MPNFFFFFAITQLTPAARSCSEGKCLQSRHSESCLHSQETANTLRSGFVFLGKVHAVTFCQ